MSTLHDAARRVVAAWAGLRPTRPSWIEDVNAAVLALGEALKAQPEPAGCETEANCTSQPWCRISGECHRKQKPPEPAQEPVAWMFVDDTGMRFVSVERPHKDFQPLYTASQPQPELVQEPVAWATEIIDALQAQYDTEMIKENDSGDALIRLDDAIAAVEDAEKHYTTPPKPEPAQEPVAWTDALKDAFFEGFTAVQTYNDTWLNSPEEAWRDYKPPNIAPQPQRKPLTVQDLQQALVDTGLIFPEAIDDAEGFDHGVTLERIDKLHLLLVGVAS